MAGPAHDDGLGPCLIRVYHSSYGMPMQMAMDLAADEGDPAGMCAKGNVCQWRIYRVQSRRAGCFCSTKKSRTDR